MCPGASIKASLKFRNISISLKNRFKRKVSDGEILLKIEMPRRVKAKRILRKYTLLEKPLIWVEIDGDNYIVNEPEISNEELHRVQEILREILFSRDESLFDNLPERVRYYVLRETRGYGKIHPLVLDENIEDINILAPGPVYIKHTDFFKQLKTNIFLSHEDIINLAHKLAYRAGKPITLTNPLVRFELEGMRIHISVGGEVSLGYSIVLRKFRKEKYSIPELVRLDTLNPYIASYIITLLLNKRSILIVGIPRSGKTTLLQALIGCLPRVKISLIQVTSEIRLPQPPYIIEYFLPRESETLEGGKISLTSLVENSLRYTSPDYLILGEIAGEEAFAWTMAAKTKIGTMATFHAGGILEALRGLSVPPYNIPIDMLLASIDAILLMANIKEEGGGDYRRLVEFYIVDNNYKKLILVSKYSDTFYIADKRIILSKLDPYSFTIPVKNPSILIDDIAKLIFNSALRRKTSFIQFTQILWKYYENNDVFHNFLKSINVPKPR
ncbi:MAG TPA: hypothetical protein ENG40_04120, partial [Thermoprotei archaeon]|nr:hypothetical protein [Thermoprotei archaeon]